MAAAGEKKIGHCSAEFGEMTEEQIETSQENDHD